MGFDLNTGVSKVDKCEFKAVEIKDESFVGVDYKKYDPLLRFAAVNKFFRLRDILEGYGLELDFGNIFCPFHPDEAGGKKSARYHPNSDILYCYSEGKTYTAYHGLKLLYNYDMGKAFEVAWLRLDDSVKQKLIMEYSTGSDLGNEIKDPIWEKGKMLMSFFQAGKIGLSQFKVALYKISRELYYKEMADAGIITNDGVSNGL